MPQFYQIYVDRVKVLMHSDEPIDAPSIRLSGIDYAGNEESTKSDDDDNA